MSLFTGEYECKLDDKGRMALPSKVKSKLPEIAGNQLVLSMGLEPCLVVYTLVEYKKIFSKVASLNEFNAENRKLQRNFFRRMAEVELDSAGRILIPKHMALYANLEKDVTLVGLGVRLELWDAKSYMEYVIKDGEEFSELVQKHLTEQ